MPRITNTRRFLLFLLIIVVLIMAGVYKIAWGSSRIQKSGQIEIEAGSSANSVWQKAASEGFTSRALPWKYHGWRKDAANTIQAGTYQIERGESVAEVIDRFIAGEALPDELTLTFPEGFTIEQMAERTAAKGIGTKEEFLAAAVPTNFVEQFGLLKEIPAGRDLEGYLFPDTYHIFADDTPRDVVQRMLANFHVKLTEELRNEIIASGRTIDEVIIMASIVEREVISDSDMAMVAGVLWKRFDDGVGLGADATTRYALSKWDGALTVQDLANDSPYNTRKFRGLPPGPISNPGLRALVATVRPEESEYYYYLSTPTGETIFSKTNDEHNANKAKYLR